MIRTLIGLALSATVLTPAAAHADPTPAPAHLTVTRIDSAPAGPAITVTLSNGRSDVLRPCRYEDGRRCYWNAGTRGNGIGQSFVVMSGHYFDVAL